MERELRVHGMVRELRVHGIVRELRVHGMVREWIVCKIEVHEIMKERWVLDKA